MNLPEGVAEDRRKPSEVEASMPALIAGLAASASQLSTTAHDLYRASVLSRLERVVAIVLVFGLTATLLVTGYGVLRLNNIAEVNRDNGDYIRDCTTPGGECFESNNERTARLIANLNRTTLVTIQCADRMNGDDAISQCVQERLMEGS